MLYSLEEVCESCIYAVWHDCCYGGPTFCHCEVAAEVFVDHLRKKCGGKKLAEVKKK